jgi:tRNA-splicing ligase RtcB (3'-phosphate/5'-hydroxy nucleic acid ligase)
MATEATSGFALHCTPGGVPIRHWTRGVDFDVRAREQLERIAQLPFVHRYVAAMPDVHVGIGATIGSVVPTRGAVIPAAVGVDIGCGMTAVRTSLVAADLPESLRGVRAVIEAAVPHGFGGRRRDRGAWGELPPAVAAVWAKLAPGYRRIVGKHPEIEPCNAAVHLGTLGSGNHFIELCLDQLDRVWIMLHSGSRGVGNRIGSRFIELAKEDMALHHRELEDRNLSYLDEGTEHFDDYVEAVGWAQGFAACNRALMMDACLDALRSVRTLPPFEARVEAVDCHHNYVAREHHFGADVLVTRKGAVRAGLGELGIIPGSMGARSFIVRGKGNPDSLCSCSHGAGRAHSRTAARKLFSLADHAAATAGVECRKDEGVLDETPAAYKSIDAVMAAQADLVEVVHTLRQLVCVKG